MRISTLVFALTLASGVNSCAPRRLDTVAPAVPSVSTPAPAAPASPVAAVSKIDFATQVRPILESRCQPCHFSGGIMYQRLPFDRPETINALGTKLFSRIKDENERRLIGEFLSQQAEHGHPSP